MFYRQLSVSCAAKFLLLASFLAFSQSTLANKGAETGEFEASAFKGARPGDRFTSGPWNDFLDPTFNADQISISRSDFINCAKTLYSGILPNDEVLYSANYDTDDGLDPRSEDWDWEEELGH